TEPEGPEGTRARPGEGREADPRDAGESGGASRDERRGPCPGGDRGPEGARSPGSGPCREGERRPVDRLRPARNEGSPPKTGASGVGGAPRTGAGTRPRREGGGGQSEGRGRESPRGPAGTQGTRGRLGQATRRRRGSREGAQGADAGPPSRPERAGQGPRRTR